MKAEVFFSLQNFFICSFCFSPDLIKLRQNPDCVGVGIATPCSAKSVHTFAAVSVDKDPANMQDRANVGHQLAGLAKRRQICQRFANVANVLPTSLQTP